MRRVNEETKLLGEGGKQAQTEMWDFLWINAIYISREERWEFCIPYSLLLTFYFEVL